MQAFFKSEQSPDNDQHPPDTLGIAHVRTPNPKGNFMARIDNRTNDQLRTCTFQDNFLRNAGGSVFIEQGNTRVICAVSVVNSVPGWMKNQKVSGGWLTSEYQMLPASTHTRTARDINRGKLNGRSQEIQRLIGRSLRAVVDMKAIGENTIYVDCDVIDADGGTRCASINGAAAALQIVFQKMIDNGVLTTSPLSELVAAVSVGIVDGVPMLDLCYEEDSNADVDMNIVMTESGKFVEIQGTGETRAFSTDEMAAMMDLARKGIADILKLQKNCVGKIAD